MDMCYGQNIRRQDSNTLIASAVDKVDIKITTYHFSCQCDKVDLRSGNNYGGMVVYSMGSLEPTTGVKIKAGYVFLKDTGIFKK